MSNTNTGGPAFPVVDYKQPNGVGSSIMTIIGGMTLRDYFAAKAMLGELAAQSERAGFYENLDALAVLSYRIADAMLKARDA